jgi:hypothetical protein
MKDTDVPVQPILRLDTARFQSRQVVNVTVESKDLANPPNVMPNDNYSFTTNAAPPPPPDSGLGVGDDGGRLVGIAVESGA